MAEYIELTEELILSMRAGARAIANTKKYHGTIYVSDLFSENPKEMPYLKAAEILYAASEKESADVTTVRHGHWCWEGRFRACSICGSYVEFTETLGASHWKYCPYCGARMNNA